MKSGRAWTVLWLCIYCINVRGGMQAGAAETPPAPVATPPDSVAQIEVLIKSAGEKWQAQDYQAAMDAASQAHTLSQGLYGPNHAKTKQIEGMIAAARTQGAMTPTLASPTVPAPGLPIPTDVVVTYTYEQYMEAMVKASEKFLTSAYLTVETELAISRRRAVRALVSGGEKYLKVSYRGRTMRGEVDVESYMQGLYLPEEAAQDAVERAATKMEAFIKSGEGLPGLNAFDIKAEGPAAAYRQKVLATPPKYAVTPTPEPTPVPLPPVAGAKLREAHQIWLTKDHQRALNLGKEALTLMKSNAPKHPRIAEVELAIRKAEEIVMIGEVAAMQTPVVDPYGKSTGGVDPLNPFAGF